MVGAEKLEKFEEPQCMHAKILVGITGHRVSLESISQLSQTRIWW